MIADSQHKAAALLVWPLRCKMQDCLVFRHCVYSSFLQRSERVLSMQSAPNIFSSTDWYDASSESWTCSVQPGIKRFRNSI